MRSGFTSKQINTNVVLNGVELTLSFELGFRRSVHLREVILAPGSFKKVSASASTVRCPLTEGY